MIVQSLVSMDIAVVYQQQEPGFESLDCFWRFHPLVYQRKESLKTTSYRKKIIVLNEFDQPQTAQTRIKWY